MAMIEMRCPHCGETLRIGEKYRGQQGRCMRCGGAIQVAGPAAPERADAPGEETPVGAIRAESFGAYGKAGDEGWVDPYEQAQAARERSAGTPAKQEGGGRSRAPVAIALVAALVVLFALVGVFAWILATSVGDTGCRGQESSLVVVGDTY